MVQTETFQMSGIRCERCVGRLAGALRGHEGLELANANLMGEVILSWDDDKTSREALLAEMARVGFHPTVNDGRSGLVLRPLNHRE